MTAWVRDVLDPGGYLILALLLVAENLFPPLPSEVILPLAGAAVAAGDLQFIPTVLAATAGSLTGALVLYAVGRGGGHTLLVRYGHRLGVSSRDRERAERAVARYGTAVVLLGRLVPGVRSVVSLPAGAGRMPLGRFVVLTTIGSTIWNAALVGAGRALGGRWHEATELVDRATVPVLVVVLVAVAVGLLVFAIRRRRARTP